MKRINKLVWDTNFFGIEVGELIVADDENVNLDEASAFKFIIVKQGEDFPVKLIDFRKSFQETKVLFSKNISNVVFDDLKYIFDTDEYSVSPTELYELAFASGKYSRYNLDEKLSTNVFHHLYKEWVIGSLNKSIADKVFCIKEENIIIGFVSVKKEGTVARIGLIAVADAFQGRGFGALLVKRVEYYCLSEGIKTLTIPTQKENYQACAFYEKNGYMIIEEVIVKHYWNKKYDTI